MNETVWKVVFRKKRGRVRYSAVIPLEYGGLEYQKGKTTEAPEGTRLLAFRTLKTARMFANANAPHMLEVWEAEAPEARGEKTLSSIPWWEAERFRDFWSGGSPWVMEAPSGTVSCTSLTLKEKVS